MFHFNSSKNKDFYDLFSKEKIGSMLRLVQDGIIVGIFAGLLSSAFRFSLEKLAQIRDDFLGNTDPLWILFWFIALMIMGYMVYRLLKWAPLSSGSGIPQIEGEMMGLFDMPAWKVLIAKYLGGSITSLAGFSVGREGPSIQVGGAAGKIISRILKRDTREERLLISAGAASGLTAAFNAPISGAIFIFEEVHKSFFPLLLVPTFTATLITNYIASLIFGLEPTLGFTIEKPVPLDYFPPLVALGVFMGILGVLFNKAIIGAKKIFDTTTLEKPLQIILTFITVGIVSYLSLDLIGGGNSLVAKISNGDPYFTLEVLLFLLIGKLLLTAFCYGCGAQGGIFLPILVIGASGGALFYKVLLAFNLVPNDYLGNFVLVAMGGIMAASIRTPLLSILLVLEMTQSFENTYPLGVCTIVSYLTAEFLKQAPIYDTLLEMMSSYNIKNGMEQTIFPIRISCISPLCGKELNAIKIDKDNFSIISLERRGKNLLPKDDEIIMPEDLLYISCAKNKLEMAKHFFKQYI